MNPYLIYIRNQIIWLIIWSQCLLLFFVPRYHVHSLMNISLIPPLLLWASYYCIFLCWGRRLVQPNSFIIISEYRVIKVLNIFLPCLDCINIIIICLIDSFGYVIKICIEPPKAHIAIIICTDLNFRPCFYPTQVPTTIRASASVAWFSFQIFHENETKICLVPWGYFIQIYICLFFVIRFGRFLFFPIYLFTL